MNEQYWGLRIAVIGDPVRVVYVKRPNRQLVGADETVPFVVELVPDGYDSCESEQWVHDLSEHLVCTWDEEAALGNDIPLVTSGDCSDGADYLPVKNFLVHPETDDIYYGCTKDPPGTFINEWGTSLLQIVGSTERVIGPTDSIIESVGYGNYFLLSFFTGNPRVQAYAVMEGSLASTGTVLDDATNVTEPVMRTSLVEESLDPRSHIAQFVAVEDGFLVRQSDEVNKVFFDGSTEYMGTLPPKPDYVAPNPGRLWKDGCVYGDQAAPPQPGAGPRDLGKRCPDGEYTLPFEARRCNGCPCWNVEELCI